MNKALLPLLLCCFIFPASGKDAGWQWYNEKINPKEKENKPVPAASRQEPDIMQKLAALQTATKRALYEAILYPGVDNFVKYFRLQNYWTQQAGLFTMSAKKAMLAHPELDYNLQYSHYNGTVRNQLAADQVQQRQAIAKLAEHYGIMFFYRGQAQRLGVKYFPAMMLVDPKQGSVRPLSYGFISQDYLAKQFLNVSEDFKPNF
ncbi:conjugal transfer protein TraF [Escherichia coli]|uniref:conjugal transfer protein TraF n=1 Tax=Escherichia coli TaxID=562 RepID=UPI0039764D58